MANTVRYTIKVLLLTIVGLPVALQCLLVPVFMVTIPMKNSLGIPLLYALYAGITVLVGSLTFVFARRAQLPSNFSARYLPVVAALLVTWLVWALAMALNGGDFEQLTKSPLVLVFLPYFGIFILLMMEGNMWVLLSIASLLYATAVLFFWLGSRHRSMDNLRGRWPVAAVFSVLLCVLLWQADDRRKAFISGKLKGEALIEEVNLAEYRPFAADNVLVKIQPPPSLHFDDDTAPRLDGATAAYPVYAAMAQALYSPEQAEKLVQANKTDGAYKNLIDGKTDIIFVAQASEEHIRAAKQKGVELKFTPIAKEAFVFLVSQSNSVASLTLQQIQGIYSGKFEQWSDVGGTKAPIIAFQRPENSGSQTVMKAKVMQGVPLRQALKEEVVQGMGGLVSTVARYRNSAHAIGYSFRYYTTRMKNQEAVKLLSVNGVSPSTQSIRSSTYPLTVDVYMVTSNQSRPSTQKLMDWILSKQGQQLIEDTGYVPVR